MHRLCCCFQLIEWRPPHMSESYDLQIRVTFASGVEGLKQEMQVDLGSIYLFICLFFCDNN